MALPGSGREYRAKQSADMEESSSTLSAFLKPQPVPPSQAGVYLLFLTHGGKS